MSRIVVQRPHRLSLAGARRVAETIARRLQRDYGGTFAWDGDTLRFSRTGAAGHVAVHKRDVEVLVDVGWLLRPLHGRIEREVHALLDEHLEAPAAVQPSRPAARPSAAARSSRSHVASRSVRPK